VNRYSTRHETAGNLDIGSNIELIASQQFTGMFAVVNWAMHT
jgi:hypothetical protein